MNKAILIGRLTADPVTSTTPTGVAVSRFSLAIDRPYKSANGEKQTDFINCIAWRSQADFMSKYFHKGDPCVVVGSIQTRNYEKDGQKKYITEVVADNIEFVPRNSGNVSAAPNASGNNGFERKSIDDLEPLDDGNELPF